MSRLILIVFPVILFIAVIFSLGAFRKPQFLDAITSRSATKSADAIGAAVRGDTEEKLNELRSSVDALKKQMETQVGTPTASVQQVVTNSKNSLLPTLQDRVDSLEQMVASLQKRVLKMEDANPPLTQTKSPLYIPMSGSGASSSLTYKTVDNDEVTIDTADYPGYKEMRLEISMRVFQGNGQAFAMLQNVTDNQFVFNSEVSTTSESYVALTSGPIQLPKGKKVYRIMLKSLTGYEAAFQNARLKVSF